MVNPLKQFRAWWHRDILLTLGEMRTNDFAVLLKEIRSTDILELLKGMQYNDLVALLKDMQTTHVVIPAPGPSLDPGIAECPICHTPYEIGESIPTHVKEATIVCNNPSCGEHMDLARTPSGGWVVRFRRRQEFP